MGVWGSGLYSGDFAMDLRSTISALARLPFDPDRLVEILCQTEPAAAINPNDEENTTFWLIVADQFSKRGIVCDRAREKALEIIDSNTDLTVLHELGMKDSDLRKRRKLLAEVRTRITAAPVPKARTVLKNPQPLLMEVGDVVVYPTRNGGSINPYYATIRMVNGRSWIPDGWGAAIIIGCGRAFDFLSWYRPLTLAEARGEKPALDWLRSDVLWRLELPGACSPTHFKRLELEKIGNLPLDSEKLAELLHGLRPGISAAVSDITLANRLKAVPYGSNRYATVTGNARLGNTGTLIMGIGQILQDDMQHASYM